MKSTISAILVIVVITLYWYSDKQMDETISKLEETIEKATFSFYYVPTEKKYGADDLQEYLQSRIWREDIAAEREFDCSKMSAYLEWRLENQGYHTVIVSGNSPDGSGRHAWLLVETNVGGYTPVEATTRNIVDRSSPYYDNYFKYELYFETIQEALSYSSTEFKWW